ncbi:GAF domain-containing protein [Dyadobacter sp. CY345]|uniref:GAF domain-containing protein n=1 Tax=Dyadobacter sp. CY345 TaxID=2909335 RepID=UPI001F2C1B2C|nr:GAF domain-containing protein [Dyadobacter sp. CY345]MCF2446864.1 GAF domain-containing protein [Dyadobacter sp. CY345]
MKETVLDISQHVIPGLENVDVSLSFRKFISNIEDRIRNEKTVKKKFFEFVHERFTADPRFAEDIDLDEIGDFQEQLSLIYNMLVPVIADENETLWALSIPLSQTVFYETSAFHDLLTDESSGHVRCDLLREIDISIEKKQKAQMIYSFLLEKFYNIPAVHSNDLVISIRDEKTCLAKYYRLNLCTDFVEVTPKVPLPELNFDEIQQHINNDFDWSVLTKIIPLSSFSFKGFTVITLTDVTADQSVENIKNIILNPVTDTFQSYYEKIIHSLNLLVGSREISFGLLPELRVNNKLVFNDEFCTHSILVQTSFTDGINPDDFLAMADEYFGDPKIYFYKNLADALKKNDFLAVLEKTGVQSYALLPVYNAARLVGVLEVYSKTENLMDEKMLSRLEPALPLIGQLMQIGINKFDAKIEDIIREKFTSLQPAVQWKFKDVAWHYLRDNAEHLPKTPIEVIQFKDVYPLYGAVDIRNSTIERNAALHADLEVQFEALIKVLTHIKEDVGLGLADEVIFKCKKWMSKISDQTNDQDESKVMDFLEYEVYPFLHHFKESKGRLGESIKAYYELVDKESGIAFLHRNALENSMQKINSAVNLYLELFKNEIQETYPCYFEKFRTDGVEYDIYIGQAIAPDKPFNLLYLNNIRLWQLTSMAGIARIAHELIPQIEKPLETTQLIFINAGSIDISFRDDERRFDVEGSYNIRYHVIKKRIDKVHVKETGERLTQPGKIALVYFNSKSAEEYVNYIKYLQEKNMLKNDLEFLDLEELQGVAGLKALRIGVNLEGEWK